MRHVFASARHPDRHVNDALAVVKRLAAAGSQATSRGAGIPSRSRPRPPRPAAKRRGPADPGLTAGCPRPRRCRVGASDHRRRGRPWRRWRGRCPGDDGRDGSRGLHLDLESVGDGGEVVGLVDVSSHRVDRAALPQRIEDHLPDITGMEEDVAVPKRGQGLGADEPVGVADDPDAGPHRRSRPPPGAVPRACARGRRTGQRAGDRAVSQSSGVSWMTFNRWRVAAAPCQRP